MAPFWNANKFTFGPSGREQTFLCESSNKIYVKTPWVESVKELQSQVVDRMNQELGMNTLLIVKTDNHVNIRCLKECLFYLTYIREGMHSLKFKRTIFAGHSVKAHIELN